MLGGGTAVGIEHTKPAKEVCVNDVADLLKSAQVVAELRHRPTIDVHREQLADERKRLRRMDF